jgi:cell wall-associated NlpC family hydrolase
MTPPAISPRRQAVVDAAMGWLKTPWHHHARVKGAGVDCAQYPIAVYAEAGHIEEFDTGDYPPDWMLHRSEERFLEFVQRYAEQVDAPLPGDLVVYLVGRCFSHGAIVLDWPHIIHASNRDRMVCLADGTQGWLAGRAVQFWRVKGVDA